MFHFGVFAMLSLILSVGLRKQYSFPKLRCNAFFFSIMLSILYGVIIEAVQVVYFEGRSGELLDIIANTFGACFGYVLFKIIYGNTRISASLIKKKA